MRASIRDKEALLAVSPIALSAYARASGWKKINDYGDHSDVYMSEGMPEIILPRTQLLGDYASIVSQLIEIFAKVADIDQLALYRDLVTADRDVIRVRSSEGENTGSVPLSTGVSLLSGAHDMLLAAACSLNNPRPFYRAGANREAITYLNDVRLGQTEQGSYVITLLTPIVPPPIQETLYDEHDDDPIERQVTRRLADVLTITQKATEDTVGGKADSFSKAVKDGVSANMCQAIVDLIGPFPAVDISLTWARTRPIKSARKVLRFAKDDAPILREAARSFREHEPQPDMNLFGFVQILRRNQAEIDGTITLKAPIDGQLRSVTTVLNQSDYAQAVQAHKDRKLVSITGDLERIRQRWRLLNPRIVEVITIEDAQQ